MRKTEVVLRIRRSVQDFLVILRLLKVFCLFDSFKTKKIVAYSSVKN